MSLHIDLEHRRKTLIVRLSGELDHHTSNEVKEKVERAIEEGDSRHLLLSLKDLSFMDSSGLGVVLGRYKLITGRGGSMIVCDANPSVYRLFEMSGMFKILAFEPNEQLALTRLEVVS